MKEMRVLYILDATLQRRTNDASSCFMAVDKMVVHYCGPATETNKELSIDPYAAESIREGYMQLFGIH